MRLWRVLEREPAYAAQIRPVFKANLLAAAAPRKQQHGDARLRKAVA